MTNKNNSLEEGRRWALFAEFSLDLHAYQLFRNGERVALPARAGQVLALLLRRHGVLVERETIVAEVWGHRHVDFETSLNTAIASIRRALSDEASRPTFVETVPRFGYRFLPQPAFSESATLQQRRISNRWWLPAMSVVLVTLALVWANWPAQKSASLQSDIASPGYEAYLQGRYALSTGQVEQAREYLSTALQLDSQLAPAHVSMARVEVAGRSVGWSRLLAARAHAEKALTIDPDLVSAHVLSAGLATYYWRDRAEAKRHLGMAFDAAPDDPDALKVQSYIDIIEGQVEKALTAISKAHQLRPLSPALNADYGWVLYKAGDWANAERMCKASLELNQRSQFAVDCLIHVNHSQQDFAEAAEYGLIMMSLRGASEAAIDSVRSTNGAAERERAYWQWALQWLQAHCDEVNDCLSKTAIAMSMLGHDDQAVATLDRAFERGNEAFLAFLAVDPRLQALRQHADFARLASASRSAWSEK